MKLTFTLLAATLATSVSAASYTLCCCTKLTPREDLKDRRYFSGEKPGVGHEHDAPTEQCNHEATKAVADSRDGYFAFTTYFWEGYDGVPRMKGQDYIYATGKNGEDKRIGPKEIKGLCGRQNAGRYC
ncbi:hypothetical protein Vi05172_g8633 [Venturia inaequalis]|nr:hypothetical protein Vi05172_g8633 [Venturia inaequalis]